MRQLRHRRITATRVLDKGTPSLRRPAAADDTGASAVEMALILPVLVLFLAGIMDFGIVFNNLMGVRQGLSAGVRQGVVAQSGTSSTCVMTGAGSAPEQTKRLICLLKSGIGLDPADTRINVYFPAAKTKGGSLVICAQYPMESSTTLLSPIINGRLTSKVAMRIEQDLSAFASASETPLPGGDWSWCR